MLPLSNLQSFITTVSGKVCIGLSMLLAHATFSTAGAAEHLNVVELFTSQACYSCPAADKLLHEKAVADERILNLEFHVDYWNKLRYGKAGVWVDPYSSVEYTERQRRYAGLNLYGNNGVYTPQAIINGSYGLVGSDEYHLIKGLKRAVLRPVEVNIARSGDAELSIEVGGDASVDADVFIVHFLRYVSTDVPTGENHGKLMENHNVVIDMQSLGSVAELAAVAAQIPYKSEENRGCAVIVQRASLGPILGAARCP